MNYGKINKFDIANGEGIRVSLFVSGCRNACPGCFQRETWDFNYGTPFDEAAQAEIFSALDEGQIRGLTVLGGEPMEPENQRGLLPLLLRVREKYPNKNIWLYTGNTYEELLGDTSKHIDITERLLSLVDILVDGRFEADKYRLGLRFRGSENQRIIDMNKTREEGRIVLWDGMTLDKSFNGGKNENQCKNT